MRLCAHVHARLAVVMSSTCCLTIDQDVLRATLAPTPVSYSHTTHQPHCAPYTCADLRGSLGVREA